MALSFNDRTTPSCRAAFEKVAPISYAHLRTIALRGLEGVSYFYILHDKTRTAFNVKYALEATTPAAPHSGCDSYNIDFNTGLIESGYLQCTKRDRSTGRGMLANQLCVGMATGMQRLHMHAGGLTGGYVWARAGVHVMPSDRASLSRALQARLHILRDHLPAAFQAKMMRLAALNKPDDLHALSNQSALIVQAARPFDQARLAEEPSSISPWARLLVAGFAPTPNLPLGPFLLFGQRYKAGIDFANASQMANVGAYTNTAIPHIKRTPV